MLRAARRPCSRGPAQRARCRRRLGSTVGDADLTRSRSTFGCQPDPDPRPQDRPRRAGDAKAATRWPTTSIDIRPRRDQRPGRGDSREVVDSAAGEVDASSGIVVVSRRNNVHNFAQADRVPAGMTRRPSRTIGPACRGGGRKPATRHRCSLGRREQGSQRSPTDQDLPSILGKRTS